MSPASVINARTVKPSPFKDKALYDAIEAKAREAARGMEADFDQTTETWKHEVEFKTVISMLPSVLVSVRTDDEIYGYVNDGTKEHPIFPKRGKSLKFQWGGKGSYTPKTKVRIIGSGPGGPSGPVVHMAHVQHPGTKARGFDVAMLKRWDPRFKSRMEQAMSEAAKASGHLI